MASVSAGGSFPSSHWSVIVRARDASPEEARIALEDLCRRYWYPLYAYVRRQVGTHHEAEDVTQGFFAHLLQKDVIAEADPARGRFRAFLLSCCKNYLSKHRRATGAEKNGGHLQKLPLDFENADGRYAREPADLGDAEQLYLRRWALTVLDESFALLEAEYEADGRGELFRHLRPTLTRGEDAQSCAAIGLAVQLSEAAVRKAAQRMRGRFRDVLRRRIGDTVDGPEAVDDELRDLFAAVR
jgi:RNA polymerase sigma-70 factor (ECF subfamily)